ncbi:hypothetical protein B0I35DRAFT_415333 [Stachybotrys elegans]|uniref:Uncharacterized protein n=1 Tax=Stachybotrys elegans TaxID=80388 RepID=A0A8K0SFF6_9HYPO|nr:hypothetical protein B0I35DRAFT_415333 [Stachybotrys elegans]
MFPRPQWVLFLLLPPKWFGKPWRTLVARSSRTQSLSRLVDPETFTGITNAVNFLDHSGVLTTDEVEIKTRRLSVETVMTAFLKRTTIGHQVLNLATEFLADSLSKRREPSMRISRDEDTLIMHLDCGNIPSTSSSPGGSSGGEGAAVGSECSVGTDIGGRQASNAYGFKPKALRNPALRNLALPCWIIGGQESIRGCRVLKQERCRYRGRLSCLKMGSWWGYYTMMERFDCISLSYEL